MKMKSRKKKRSRALASVLIALTVTAGVALAGILIFSVYRLFSESGGDLIPTGTPAETPSPVEFFTPEPTLQPTPEPTPGPVATPSPLKVTPSFPKSAANRAAITAMTNYFASDTRSADGSFNSAAFHAYSDTSGDIDDYLIYDWELGIWTGKSSDTWHVENLQLARAAGDTKYVSLDVSIAADYYVISRVFDVTDGSTEKTPLDGGVCFWVPAYLIEEDRFS